jgi:hypothetical protein
MQSGLGSSGQELDYGYCRGELHSSDKVIRPFIFFVSLLLMVWGGLRLVVPFFLRVAIILRYRGCGVWILVAFWTTQFQLAVSPFNWINQVMEEVGRMFNKEASRGSVSPSANPVWRKLVLYIPSMSMVVIGLSLLY